MYVVKVRRSVCGTPESHEEYLAAIRYDPYQTGNVNTHCTSPSLDEAFKFQTLAAAEMAAVFVGGWVYEPPQE